jgi:hypothetical protein
MLSEVVETKDGQRVTVMADSKEELAEAVKSKKNDAAPVYPNINHPVQKGHDLVATGPDVSKVLVDGTGAHNSPENAIDDNGKETGDKDVKAAGLDEPAYKSVPAGGNQDEEPRVATKSEVKAAKKDSKPANEVR